MNQFFDVDAAWPPPIQWLSNPAECSAQVPQPTLAPDHLIGSDSSPENLAALLSACEPIWQPAPLNYDLLPQTMTEPAWSPSLDENNSVVNLEKVYDWSSLSLLPGAAVSNIFQDGFGDPTTLLDCPSQLSLPLEGGPSPPAFSGSSSSSPSDYHTAYGCSTSRPTSAIQPSSQWNFKPFSSAFHSSSAVFRSGSESTASPPPPIKRHRCQICGRAFQRQTTLAQHQITHTGERPYACPVSGCNKAFTTASNAKRHAKTHYRLSNTYCTS